MLEFIICIVSFANAYYTIFFTSTVMKLEDKNKTLKMRKKGQKSLGMIKMYTEIIYIIQSVSK